MASDEIERAPLLRAQNGGKGGRRAEHADGRAVNTSGLVKEGGEALSLQSHARAEADHIHAALQPQSHVNRPRLASSRLHQALPVQRAAFVRRRLCVRGGTVVRRQQRCAHVAQPPAVEEGCERGACLKAVARQHAGSDE